MSSYEMGDLDRQLRMAKFLAEIGYRDLACNANSQRLSVSRRLLCLGVDERILRLLWQYAHAGSTTPIRLFAWWIDKPSRAMAKIDELRKKECWTSRVLEKIVAAEPEPGEEAPIFSLSDYRKQS